MSWKRDIGFFERTNDMVFCLERRYVNGKPKRRPAIRRDEDGSGDTEQRWNRIRQTCQ